ncbi:MAG TPA: pyridoxamine 5'-phosphate oxidase family protein [Kofleriaceae bacterium]|nr:pyridoxamine 5'-phosphate oxidase family protein [Kofleriaceae bacterium]
MIEQRLREILAGNATLTLATADVAPWVAAAYFAEDGAFVLDLMLEARGRTLANLRARPAIAVMLQDGNPMSPFAQGEGVAEVLAGTGVADEVRSRIIRKTPASAPLVGLPEQYPVRLRIARWRVTDVPAGWLPARELRA